MLNEVVIQFSDLEDTRQIIDACLNYFFARDLSESQRNLEITTQKSPIVQELEIVKSRLENYLGDYLRGQYEEGLDGAEVDEVEPEPELEPAVEEALAELPLGKPVLPKQKGRRVSRKELQERDEDQVA